MNKKVFWLSIIAVIASFAGGFLVANSLNRREITALQNENENLKNAQTETERNNEEFSLTEAEIRQKIDEADRNPNNTAFQKNLGLALYNYASMKQNTDLLKEVSRLLNRVYDKNPKDYETVVTLGNINFDIGYFNKSNEDFQMARSFYQKALEQKPNDSEVITDLGLTYFLADPPDFEAARADFQKSLQIEPKNEKTLQVMIETLVKAGKNAEAEKYIADLKEVNPKNDVLSNLNSSQTTNETDFQKQ